MSKSLSPSTEGLADNWQDTFQRPESKAIVNTVFFVSKNHDYSSSYEEQTFQALQMLCIFISALTILLKMSEGEGSGGGETEGSEKGEIKR